MIQHNLIQTDYGYYCKICRWKWRSPPTSGCPGVQRFGRWVDIPNHLKTKSELFKAGLKPGDNLGPDGCLYPPTDRHPRYWLYDARQAIPKHKQPANLGEDLAIEKAIAIEAKRLWENKEIYTETYKTALISALPMVRAKFISFKAKAQVTNLPGEFSCIEIETSKSLPTHIKAIEFTRKFLEQLLCQGIPNRTLDRENLHEYLRQWGSGFIRLQDSEAGFYVRVNQNLLTVEYKTYRTAGMPTVAQTTSLPTYQNDLAKPNINYWSWSKSPESWQFCPELTALLTLPEPNPLVRLVLEALPEGKDPFFNPEKSNPSSKLNFSSFAKRGKFALRADKSLIRNAFIEWHKTAQLKLGIAPLNQIYQVVYGASWELIEEILTPSSGEWWEVLGVTPDASKDDVKKAYRSLLGMFHPDINKSVGSHERAVAINRAYEQYEETH